MLAQRFPQGNGCALVKQYPHYSSGSQRASRRVFEHGVNLFQRNAGKPLHELGNLRAVLKVLKQRGNGHTRVPRNNQAPLTRSGSRSTAGQVDQSIMKPIVALPLYDG